MRQPSHRVHGRYERTLVDLPCVSFSLTLIVHTTWKVTAREKKSGRSQLSKPASLPPKSGQGIGPELVELESAQAPADGLLG